MDPKQACGQCQFFRPKFWSSDAKPLFVSVSHVCGQFVEAQDSGKEIL